MKPLTTSVYTFSKLIEGGFLYVDKTGGILDLVRPAAGQYFLSRPRRFGKSLLVSTLRALFEGRRELFEGLAIADSDYDWRVYPVVHLDLASAEAGTAQELETSLLAYVCEQAREHGIALSANKATLAFRELIVALGRRAGSAVILIDEYDKPLLGHLGSQSAVEIQSVLKSFYSVIKSTEAHQRFALLTGVSKFSKVSVFSDLNNLTDLTMSRSAATLLGYTQSELESNFAEHIAHLAAEQGTTGEQALAALRDWYDGYRFHPRAQRVYNPVSVMRCLQEGEFRNYWFETGTPTFLIHLLRGQPVDLGDLCVPESAFAAYEPDRLHPLPLLVQTGYLTLEGAEERGGVLNYRLAYPNREIEQSFSYWLVRDLAGLADQDLSRALDRFLAALRESRIEDMLEHLKVFFANIPYDITLRHEKYYQTIFFTVFKLLGADIEAETRTNAGRIDAVVKTDTDIIVFEFKLQGTAAEALEQIRTQGYADRYREDGRRITLVGVAFDEATRNLGEYVVAPMECSGD